MGDLIDFLRNNTVEKILSIGHIHSCYETDSVSVAYKKLKKYHVLALPVKDASGHYTRFLDLLDLAEFVVKVNFKYTDGSYLIRVVMLTHQLLLRLLEFLDLPLLLST